jgi:hypothetical protein
VWKTEKVGKGEKHTLGPGLWQKKKKKTEKTWKWDINMVGPGVG